MASVVEIIFRTVKQGNGEKEARAALGGVNSSLADMAKSALGAVAPWATLGGAVLAASEYLRNSAKAAAESNEVMAKQAQILESTGFAANIAAFELEAMASELSRLSGIDDEVIADAQSMLLTFRNIGREEFPRAMKAALDLSTTFGGLEQSSMQLGKALNDPVKGMTALARSGVTFSEQQQDQIKNFVAANDLASAQAIILAEIENQVGGTAQAMQEAGDGSARLNVALGNLSETIGGELLPASRAWNIALAETVENTNDAISEELKYSDAVSKALDILLDGQPVWMRNSFYIAANSKEVERLASQFQRGSEMTEFATKQYLGMGGSLADLNGVMRDNVEVAAMDEEAIKALSEANLEYLGLVGDLTDEQQRFSDKSTDLAEKRAEIEAELNEKLKQGYWEQGDVIQGLRQDLEELSAAETENAENAKRAGQERILSMLEQQLAIDGLDNREMEYLLRLGQQWGIYSSEAVAAAQGAMREVERLKSSLDTLPDVKNIRIQLDVASGGNIAVTNELMRYETRDNGGPGMPGVPYVINPQAGPEVFTPSQPGTFTPNANSLFDYERLSESIVQAMARSGIMQ